MCVRAYVRVCLRKCVRTYVSLCVPVCVRVYVSGRACVQACV